MHEQGLAGGVGVDGLGFGVESSLEVGLIGEGAGDGAPGAAAGWGGYFGPGGIFAGVLFAVCGGVGEVARVGSLGKDMRLDVGIGWLVDAGVSVGEG